MSRENSTELYEQYKKVVFSVTNLYLDNPSDREDVFQETWMAVFKNLKKFNERSKLSTWIYSVARHTALNFRRKNKPRPELQEYIQKKRALDDTVINKLDLQQAIEKLNSDDQKLVVMHYSEDYSYKELAEKLDMAESTVKSRLFEARKKLRCYLNR